MGCLVIGWSKREMEVIFSKYNVLTIVNNTTEWVLSLFFWKMVKLYKKEMPKDFLLGLTKLKKTGIECNSSFKKCEWTKAIIFLVHIYNHKLKYKQNYPGISQGERARSGVLNWGVSVWIDEWHFEHSLLDSQAFFALSHSLFCPLSWPQWVGCSYKYLSTRQNHLKFEVLKL